MDNQQRKLQQELNLYGVDLETIVLSKKYLPTSADKFNFLSDLHSISREEMAIKHKFPNMSVFNNVVLRYYSYILDKPLPTGFVVAKLYDNTDYAISSDGNLITIKTRKLVPKYIDEFGYYRVNTRHYKPHTNCQGIYERFHRLLCMTFKPIENCHLLEVNHIDGNKLNNSLDNLEWLSKRDNLTHAWDNKLRLLPYQYKALKLTLQ